MTTIKYPQKLSIWWLTIIYGRLYLFTVLPFLTPFGFYIIWMCIWLNNICMLDHWATVMQVYVGSGFCLSWVLRFYIMGWAGKCNMSKFHSSFILSVVFRIFTDLRLTCQGTYLTSTARSHAIDNNFHEGAVIGDFNGEFWGVYTLHQVIFFFFFFYIRVVALLFLFRLIKN